MLVMLVVGEPKLYPQILAELRYYTIYTAFIRLKNTPYMTSIFQELFQEQADRAVNN